MLTVKHNWTQQFLGQQQMLLVFTLESHVKIPEDSNETMISGWPMKFVWKDSVEL